MKTLRILLLTSFFLAACAPVATDTNSPSSPSDMEGADDTGGNGETGAAASSDAATARVIEITASNWAFAPSAISVKKGENVVVRLRGDIGIHGFAIRGTNVSVTVNSGEVIDVTLPTDAEGSFEFFCNVPCGEGHKDMKGTLTVTA